MQSVNHIRSAFIDYFVQHTHTHVPSGSLVPLNDPSLMFVNAGMVQFKNIFTGMDKCDYSRAVTSQKCVRAGGKHNDLENVGHTARHHTFFEMLGNFSFGDYFKETAIELAWNLITKEMGLPKDRLLATVYAEDEEAFDLWRKIAGFSENRIIRIPTSDNFWAMGETGPCGPCSEIFYDHGEHIPGGPPGSAEEDGDRFVEIWNLVFMQYEQVSKNERIDLPSPSIDTGMGLERIAAVMQGVHDNYDIDLFRTLIEASADYSGQAPDGTHQTSHRVLADHLRSGCFLIADGVMPANEGRGYVLRRIMRRAMRHAHLMGAKEPLMYRLVPALVETMGQAFPELVRAEALITETLKLEETRFRTTLERGLKILDEARAPLKAGETLDGDTAFKLYDTYGFPPDLTQDVLKTHHITVDMATFHRAMDKSRTEARKAWAGSGDDATEEIWFRILDTHGATEFLGYETEHAVGMIVALVKDGVENTEAVAGEAVMVLCNQTPFYAESGGQAGDKGVVRLSHQSHEDNAENNEAAGGTTRIRIEDTKKKAGGLHVLIGTVEQGTVRTGDAVLMEIDHTRRMALRANHSVTHLIHAALRQRLGAHVTQKGSQVEADRMRFDFSHPHPLTQEDMDTIEADVNVQIRANTAVHTRLMTPDDAIESGATALFGEKYGDEVRVVSMGEQTHRDYYSTELCGGTHVRRTGDIGLCRIIAETAVASGIRRIEVITAVEAERAARARDREYATLARMLKTAPQQVAARMEQMLEERKTLERQLQQAKRALAVGGGADNGTDDGIKTIGTVKFMGRVLTDMPVKQLKGLADEMKGKIGSGVVALISTDGGKASLVVGVTEDMTETLNAVELVQIAATAVGGKGGGGRADMAQAGGPDAAKAADGLSAIENAIATAYATLQG